MPGGDTSLSDQLTSLMTEPIFKGMMLAPIKEYSRPGRDNSLPDESISSFMNRRFGTPNMTNNIISAVMHGVYAGDIDKLSVRSVMRPLWDVEEEHQSLVRGLLRSILGHTRKRDSKELALERTMLKRISVSYDFMRKNARAFNFKNGMSTLTQAIASYLKSHPNVEFKMNESVRGVEYDAETDKIQVAFRFLFFTIAKQ